MSSYSTWQRNVCTSRKYIGLSITVPNQFTTAIEIMHLSREVNWLIMIYWRVPHVLLDMRNDSAWEQPQYTKIFSNVTYTWIPFNDFSIIVCGFPVVPATKPVYICTTRLPVSVGSILTANMPLATTKGILPLLLIILWEVTTLYNNIIITLLLPHNIISKSSIYCLDYTDT